ncbi:MAG: hypothetical protein JWQ38_2505 [Flavipsychrobacter sp.]|nr:hypothetical protein [Flavipsychrobacter sp.]
MDFINKHYKAILWSIPFVSFLLHFHVFNLDLIGIHVWRQTETQTVINNFYKESLNIFNPHVNAPADTDRIFRMEFPFMQWLFALFYKIFGPHIIISRVLTFLTGLFSVYGMFHLCNSISRNRAMATICAWCFNFSPVFYYYTVNPMPDNMALCFAIWSIAMFCSYINEGRITHVLWSGIFLGLATLLKLPFILYGVFALTFVILQLKKRQLTQKQLLQITSIYILSIMPAIAWYATVLPHWNNGIVKGVLDTKQTTGELIGILNKTLISILPELLINYGSVLFFLAGFFFLMNNKMYRSKYFLPFLSLSIGILFYYFFEINMITTVHDYYLFPFLPLIFIITAFGASSLMNLPSKNIHILCLTCLAILPVTAFLRADSRWDTKDPGFNTTYYNYKQQLRDLVPENAYCIAGNDVSHYILLYYIDRKGWTFDNNELSSEQLNYYISKGAKYLFLDSHIDNKADIKAHLSEKIFDQGTLRVYKLK